jgi:peptide/nickel transport system permease protein
MVPIRRLFNAQRRPSPAWHTVDVANHMFLPVVTLTIPHAVGEYYLVMRSSLLDVMGEDYITTVRAKGIRENKVLWQHAVRNAMLPTS